MRNNNIDCKVWNVAQSNPCFEIWLYYHFFDKEPSKESLEKYASLKNFVDAMIPGGFDSRKHPALLALAISNASANYHEQDGFPNLFATEVFKLGQEILPFVVDIL